MKFNERMCDYNGCRNTSATHEIYEMDLGGETYDICSEHEPVVYDHTGYCGVDCQLGFGCDQSC